MSRPIVESTWATAGRECPYCGAIEPVEWCDISETEREEECGVCGKTFIASDEIDITHHAKPDCELNGETHEWVASTTITAYRYCNLCGKLELMVAP